VLAADDSHIGQPSKVAIVTHLHPTIEAQLREEAAADRPPIHALSIEAARERLRSDAAAGNATPPSVADVAAFDVDGPEGGELTLRAYWPDESDRFAQPGQALPVLCWYHGGGFALGDLQTTDPIARVLTSEIGCLVVTVDYRLAPEHPFPAGVEDCYATLEWVTEHAESIGGDPDRIAVGGGSAGGGLAAAVALLARDRGGPSIVRQSLVCPVTTDDQSLPARQQNASGYGLTADELAWYHEMYTPDAVSAANPYAYPLKARSLAELPPATVVTAGFDPLRDDGARFADRLDSAGVQTTYRCFESVTHSFFGMLVEPSIEPAWAAIETIESDLSAGFE